MLERTDAITNEVLEQLRSF